MENELKELFNSVKDLDLLKDNIHATTEMVAEYYQVNSELIRYFIKSNRDELELCGMNVLKGKYLKDFKELIGINLTPNKKNYSALTIFPIKAILKIGILLAGSDVAKQIRDSLINKNPKLYEELSNGHRLKFKKFEQKYWDYLSFSFGDKDIQKQVSCGSYLIDFVLYENIAIEIDENGHSSYSDEKEIIREEYIKSKGYKIVRFNPHKQKPFELIDMICRGAKLPDM